jgi:hypothetical protein
MTRTKKENQKRTQLNGKRRNTASVKNPGKTSGPEPDILEIMKTTESDGRSTRRLKVQDPDRLSDLAFKSTEDPYVPQIPWKYRGM